MKKKPAVKRKYAKRTPLVNSIVDNTVTSSASPSITITGSAWAGAETPFREYLKQDTQKRQEAKDGRTAQEKQIEYLMMQLAESKQSVVAQMDQVRLEESQKSITALTTMNDKLLNIVEHLAMGIAK